MSVSVSALPKLVAAPFAAGQEVTYSQKFAAPFAAGQEVTCCYGEGYWDALTARQADAEVRPGR